MKNYIKLLATFFTSIIFIVSIMISAGANTVSTDFEIDSELLKAITSSGLINYDKNNDQIITKKEFADSYGLIIDCEGYDIKDWSALKYGTEWKYISIKNCKTIDFSVLNTLPDLMGVTIACNDFSKVSGLETLPALARLSVESKTNIDLSIFDNFENLEELSVKAPLITGYSSIDKLGKQDRLVQISLAADTCEGILEIPKNSLPSFISFSYPDLNDSILTQILENDTYTKSVSVANCNISGLEWTKILNNLHYLDIRNNNCRDIRSLLEHKNIKTMELHLENNPWAVDTEKLLADALSDGKPIPTATPKIDYPMGEPPIWVNLNLGDVDQNNIVNAEDALLILKHAAKLSPLSDSDRPYWNGDVDVSFSLDAADALLVLKYSAKVIDSFNDFALSTYPPSNCGPEEHATPLPEPELKDYDNSFVVCISSAEKRSFSLEDFANLNAADIRIVKLTPGDIGYDYEIVVTLDDNCTKEELSAAMEAASSMENVNDVTLNKYCTRDSILEFNYKEYELKVGESICLYIDNYDPYYTSVHPYSAIIQLSENSLNGKDIDEALLNSLGVIEYQTSEEFKKGINYRILSCDYDKLDYDLPNTYAVNPISVIHTFANIPEVTTAVTLYETYPTGNRTYEKWKCSNESLLSMELIGGSSIDFDMTAVDRLDQAAILTAKEPGEVIISVTKGGWGADEATGYCKINIVE